MNFVAGLSRGLAWASRRQPTAASSGMLTAATTARHLTIYTRTGDKGTVSFSPPQPFWRPLRLRTSAHSPRLPASNPRSSSPTLAYPSREQSSLFSGERRSKADAIFDALGAVDELNAALGLAREMNLEFGDGAEPFQRTLRHSTTPDVHSLAPISGYDWPSNGGTGQAA